MSHDLAAVSWRSATVGAAILGTLVLGCSHEQGSSGSPAAAAPATQPFSTVGDTDLAEPSRDLGAPPSRLSPALQKLADASENARGLDGDEPADLPPASQVGLPAPGTRDVFSVAVHVKPDVDVKAITAAGAYIQLRLGDVLYATVHARDLEKVSEVTGVERISPMPGSSIPTPPKESVQTGPKKQGVRDIESSGGDAAQFDRHGQTGKGVVVAVIDTGIDWRHPDFMKPDGSGTRIMYLWDIFDNTYQKSNHTVGLAPPVHMEDGTPVGTLYSSKEINLAIKGQLNIPRTDSVGHGTACAGTAAGNGLGVAPDADLIIVNSHSDDPKLPEGNDGWLAPLEAEWIKGVAADLHEPCVISMSFGGRGEDNALDGTGDDEQAYDQILEKGAVPGLAICVSAGNEGETAVHARGRFGPLTPTDLNGGLGAEVELFVQKDNTPLNVIFDSRDDWRLYIVGLDKFMLGTNGKPAHVIYFKAPAADGSDVQLGAHTSSNMSADDKGKLAAIWQAKGMSLRKLGNSDMLSVTLPQGAYVVAGQGNSEKVSHGAFDLYLPGAANDSSFGNGADHKMVVGSPGDSDAVITCGSYDFRNEWQNAAGEPVHSGTLDIGNISSYSSPGFRRDGVVKPDITSPGQYTISAMADGCFMAKSEPACITGDGKHIAWAGTSASCPYTAGVIALMLEKNPQLTSSQVKQILRDTADHDLDVTGAVPNPQWGYGKLNPEKALAAVTAGSAPPVSPSPVTPSPAPPAPVAPQSTPRFAGVFKGDGLVIQLNQNPDGSFSGTMLKADQTFNLDAKLVASQLEGVVHNNGKDFPFEATLDGDNLALHANQKSFSLARQPSQ